MSKSILAAAIGAAVTTLVGVSAVFAAQPGQTGMAFQCQRQWTPSHSHPVVVYCNAQTPQGPAALRPATCDPATMSEAAMRADCKAATASQPDKAAQAGG